MGSTWRTPAFGSRLQNKALTMPLSSIRANAGSTASNRLGRQAVEAVDGQRLDAYLQDHILAPLGMTQLVSGSTGDQRARLVGMHQRGADGALHNPAVRNGAGAGIPHGRRRALFTAADYIRFVRMLLNGGTLAVKRVLKSETCK